MSNAQKPNRFAGLVAALLSPISVGILLTLVLSYVAFQYYQSKHDTERSTLYQLIDDIDKKTFDYRLLTRGIRPADPRVAVLAVDDRSIEIVGRWPWPRDVMGRAIDNAYKAGAKVIATDIVWSEPSDRPDIRLVDTLAEKSLIPPQLKIAIQEQLTTADPDKTFSTYIEKNKAQFVLGNFYSETIQWQNAPKNSGYLAACYDIIYKETPLEKITSEQGIPFVIQDSLETLLPESFAIGYGQKMQDIEQAIRSSVDTPKTAFDRYNLEQSILREKIEFCQKRFLDPETDDFTEIFQSEWETLKNSNSELQAASFQEWNNDFKYRNRLNAVTETLDWTFNLPMLATAATHHAYFNALLDPDGKLRRTQLISRTGSRYLPSIALQAYLVSKDHHAEITLDTHPKINWLKGIQTFSIANSDGEKQFDVPVSAEGQMLINYAGPAHSIPHASIADLLDESSPTITITEHPKDNIGQASQGIDRQVKKEDFFKDKILVLGVTSIGVFDLRVTPFDENFPGVETHANVIDNFLRQDFFKIHLNEDQIMTGVMLVLGLILTLALSKFGALSGLIFTGVLILIIGFIDRQFLFSKGTLVSIILPTFQVAFSYTFLTFYKYLTEERSKKELRATFSKYVSPAIVEEILKDPKNLELGGRKERVTVFFSDVRGFTTIAEKLDPRALSDLLNSYLTPMTDLVFEYKGTLDKYMGDAIMAFFGAPVHYDDHAKWACRCALAHMKKLNELQAEYAKKGLPAIDIGIGLNTGECSVGNMGSQSVRSYTVMGDAVNLASRLEGINKTYGTHIIISEFTYEEVKNDFLCREVDWVRVKGKLKPVKIFELIAEGKAPSPQLEMSKIFSEGYELYHQQQFDKAIQTFEKGLQNFPHDETAKIYVERCQEFLKEPPPADWDGVYVMKTK